ncbi:MAG: carbonic anhydrase [Polyangiales bacterium]
MKRRAWWIAASIALGLVAAALLHPKSEFVLGGAMIGVGYRLQDRLDSFDLDAAGHHGHLAPERVWREFVRQNELSAGVRRAFPRSRYHPLIAVVACMDARIDTNELMGDTRRYYYIIRTAGSVMSEREEEMLELAVANGVRLVVLTTHTDCAAERAAADPAQRARYPHLTEGVAERERRVGEFLARPAIAARIAAGELLVRRAVIDTANERITPVR